MHAKEHNPVDMPVFWRFYHTSLFVAVALEVVQGVALEVVLTLIPLLFHCYLATVGVSYCVFGGGMYGLGILLITCAGSAVGKMCARFLPYTLP